MTKCRLRSPEVDLYYIQFPDSYCYPHTQDSRSCTALVYSQLLAVWASRFQLRDRPKGSEWFCGFSYIPRPKIPAIVCRSASLCVCGTYIVNCFYCLLFVFIRSPNSCRLKYSTIAIVVQLTRLSPPPLTAKEFLITFHSSIVMTHQKRKEADVFFFYIISFFFFFKIFYTWTYD